MYDWITTILILSLILSNILTWMRIEWLRASFDALADFTQNIANATQGLTHREEE